MQKIYVIGGRGLFVGAEANDWNCLKLTVNDIKASLNCS
jgi:hypothetical protein